MKPPACQQCRTVGGGEVRKKRERGGVQGGREGGGKRWMGWKERRQKVKKRGEGKREVGGRDEARRREGGSKLTLLPP